MPLTAGTRLGPYEVLKPLGAGGMGEVYRALDPRLGREVAIKLVATEGEPSPDRLRRFETEARAAAALSHPNVVTVFDVGTHEGHPYLVLELLEGQTLRETLRGGLPPLGQAVTWALEISRGLAAAHERGIVHRDLKPENVFLTTDGRIKVLDFGLAKLHEPLVSDAADRESPTATKGTAPGVVLGTVGYMSPEQVKGETPDVRTDVFALGALLYEMAAGRRAFGGRTTPEILAGILRDEPEALGAVQPGVPASLESVVRRCLAKLPADRFSSAQAVEAALETVRASLDSGRRTGLRVAEPRGPYPGLSSFTAADAERFFGREDEVESLWGKLRRDPLLALIGPSGAGKTSFVQAGLLPARPSGWGAIVATPGGAPLRSLAQALVEELPSDANTMKQLLGFDEPDVAYAMVHRWRQGHLEALLVVDQFEELFTLNPPEVQERLAGLLGRLAREGDVHVLLSLRDDFLMRCHDHEALGRVFEHLTPLGPLSEDGLRRALTEPAKKEGFSFEDESLVDEMLESVAGVRGALPLLAFAAARLWQKRDQERRLLTREAYEEIGGVGGALAQHAEQTLEAIGLEREPIVREVFRNLVTAQWTRAVADREELLSAVPDRQAGAQVLDQLVDARLLTTYEVREAERPSGDADREGGRAPGAASRQRIEIVHESLLKAWPRLVRWQAQDEEGAVLRDQLKQAAHLWEEKDRSPDLLWSGDAFQEFEVWRRRYPGQLTALESEFAESMARREGRKKRLRRMVGAGVVAASLAVAAVVGVLRQQAVRQAERADQAALRAEASQLRALGTLHLAEDPTAALAYAIAGLERSDSPAGRRFALESLAAGPPALIADVNPTRPLQVAFSPDGEWLGTAGCFGARLLPRDGAEAWVLDDEGIAGPGSCGRHLSFAADGDHVALRTSYPRVARLLSLSKQEDVKRLEREGPSVVSFVGNRLVTDTGVEGDHRLVRAYDLESGETDVLERWNARDPRGVAVGPSGRRLAVVRRDDNRVLVRPFWGHGAATERVVGRHPAPVKLVAFAPRGDRLAAADESEQIRIWTLDEDEGSNEPVRTLQAEGQVMVLSFDPTGTRLAVGCRAGDASNNLVRVWDLAGPEGADPVALRSTTDVLFAPVAAFDPTSRLVAVTYLESLALFPLERRGHVLHGEGNLGPDLAFTPDGRSLLGGSEVGSLIRMWGLDGGRLRDARLPEGTGGLKEIAVLPGGRDVMATTLSGGAFLVSLADGAARELPDTAPRGKLSMELVVSADGRLAAAISIAPAEQKGIRVWDLESLELRVLEESRGRDLQGLAFAPDGTLFSSDKEGVVSRWDLQDDTRSTLVDTGRPTSIALSPDGRYLLVIAGGPDTPSRSTRHDLVDGGARPFTSHGDRLSTAAFDPTSQWLVTGDREGIVRVGPVTGETPHFLFGHGTIIASLAVSPDGRWIASSEVNDSAVRLWPWPDGPPVQALPLPEFMSWLRAKTNLRAVRDDTSPMGYRLEVGPFPGWETP